MTPGGKANDTNLFSIDPKLVCPAFYQAHSALGVLQGYIGAIGPTFAGKAIDEHENGIAHLCEHAPNVRPFTVNGHPVLRAKATASVTRCRVALEV